MTHFRRFFFSALTVLILSGLPPWTQVQAQSNDETDPMIATVQTTPYEWHPGEGGNLEIKMRLPPEYHAYADTVRVQILEPDGFQVSAPKISPQIQWYDKFSKRQRKGIRQEATLRAHLEAPAHFNKNVEQMKIELVYQACSDQFCLFPTTKELSVPIRLAGVTTPAITADNSVSAAPGSSPNSAVASESAPATEAGYFSAARLQNYLGGNLFVGLFFVFIAGLLTSFTPCIFPMIPITLAVLGNNSEKRSRLQNFLMSLFYVFGIATTYSILGLIAASSGSVFGASLGNPYVLGVMCAIFLTMSLSMYGLFDLQMPAAVRNKFGSGKSKGGFGGAYLTGLFAGVVASPCVGPVLVGILTFVATTQSQLTGFLYLFFYALGLGMLFIVLGLSNQFARLLPRSGAWMNGFKFVLGSLMLTAFYYYLSLLLPVRWNDFALGLGLVSVASVYGAFMSPKGQGPAQHLRKGLMQALLFVGFGYLALGLFDLRPPIRQHMISGAPINQIESLHWEKYDEDSYQAALKTGKPIIVDFWAEWCAACHELEENTLTDPRVRNMAANFVLLKFDATADTPLLRKLKEQYQIQGLPTVLFINPHGVWLKDLTLTEYEAPAKFVERMSKGMN